MFPLFWVHRSPGFPPCSTRQRILAAPRTGRIGHCLKKVAAADAGLPEVPLRVLRESFVGWVFPPPWLFWGFPGGTLRSCWAACRLTAPLALVIRKGWPCLQFAAVGSRPFDRRLEPLFSAWLGSLHSFCCARLTLVFGTASQESCGTRWRMSLSPRDRRTGSCWS